MRRPAPPDGDPATPAPARRLVPIIGLALALVALGVVGYVAWSRWLQPRWPPLVMYVAVDVSGSVSEGERKAMFGAPDQLLAGVPFERVALWTFDKVTEKRYDGNPREPRDLWAALDSCTTRPEATPGTCPAAVLDYQYQAMGRQQGDQGALVLLLWDGEDDDPAATARVVAKLADQARLKALWIVAISDDTGSAPSRSRVEQVFQPLGDRLVVSSQLDMKDGYESVLALLRK